MMRIYICKYTPMVVITSLQKLASAAKTGLDSRKNLCCFLSKGMNMVVRNTEEQPEYASTLINNENGVVNSPHSSTFSSDLISPHPQHDDEMSTSEAATMVQKFYRSYRTRRKLADKAVASGLWWQALEYAALHHRTITFFTYGNTETVIKRLKRTGSNASKVGKGLSIDAKALKLAFQHWIEAIDPRHRYGHNLHFYYEEWCESTAGQPFFYWLDVGDGRHVDLSKCPRSLLQQQRIRYLGPEERKHYEYMPKEGKVVHKQTGRLLDTTKEPERAKWIFVLSTSKTLYIGQKKKGMFHHSSFLAGGATLAAGKFMAEDGVLKRIWPHSGHYRPRKEDLNTLVTFLEENGIDINKVQIQSSTNEDYEVAEQAEVALQKTAPIQIPAQLQMPTDAANGINSAPSISEVVNIAEANSNGTIADGLHQGTRSCPKNQEQKPPSPSTKSDTLLSVHPFETRLCASSAAK